MSSVRHHPSRALPIRRFPRFAAFAAAGYLALATADFAGSVLQPVLPAAAAVRPTTALASSRGASLAPVATPSPEPAEPSVKGVASWYGRRFHGRPTASGEPFDMNDYTAAHRTLPFGTPVEVRNPRTGRAIVVRINDRGPHVRGRLIDLSYAAARDLGIAARGTARVELRLLS